jgi:Lrp/AsnC family leucine-responsive transcriptional regulator
VVLGVIEVHRILGEDCFVVRIVVEHIAQPEVAIDALAKVRPVTASIVLASYFYSFDLWERI